MIRATHLVVVTALLLASSHAVGQLTFNFEGGGTGNAQADAGFQLAADFWSSKFDDNVTVNIDSGFAVLPPPPGGGTTLAEAGSFQGTTTYAGYRTAAVADATSADDQTFTGSLPAGPGFSIYTNRTADNPNGIDSLTPFVDSTGANTENIRMNSANAKALGLLDPHNGGTDAIITFNSSVNFDFDPSDGITAGAIDFVGVAIHELGHAMGFVSGVDTLDTTNNQNGDLFLDVNPLDFTRFSADSEAAGADIDWTADAREKFYSIDGGTTPGASGTDHFSTGVLNGDGRQASHWKDAMGLGIMDPTGVPAGQMNIVTALDLQAFDVIGWDLVAVPEPSTFAFLTLAGIALSGRRLRRNRSQQVAPSLATDMQLL